MRGRWHHQFSKAAGFRGALGYYSNKLRGRIGLRPELVYTLYPKDALYPLSARSNSSDVAVFGQIFMQREYACLDNLKEVGLIIDCGANVGYSSAYFLSRFPDCEIIAVEPDPNNFVMLQRNLAPYGSRVKCIQAGVWPHPVKLVISELPYRDGDAHSKQVRECRPGEEGDIQGIDIGTILAESGHKHISILKMDVEGAEVVIFSENYESWLDLSSTVVIELHDDSIFGNGSDVFFKAINGRGFAVSESGELTVCKASKNINAVKAQRTGY